MAAQVVWTETALADLDALAAYIARDSSTYAARVVERIIAAIGRAADFPMSGRVVPEYEREALRETVVWPYRIVYLAEPDLIRIVTIVHGARLLKDDMEASY